jgi:two-component system response regulator ChvI
VNRVLLVDDERATTESWAQAFTERGYTVMRAASGAEALALLATNDFDFIISDLHMPGMSGGVLCERMRDNPAVHEAIFILVSGELTPPAFVRYDGYFRKPVDPDQLFAAMQRMIGNTGKSRANYPGKLR